LNNRYGGFWRRGFAFLIDQVILYGIYLAFFLIGLMSYACGQLAHGGPLPSAMGTWFMTFYWGAIVIVTALYFTCFVAVGGQTPGKMVLGLKVVPAEDGLMTFGTAFLRWVGYMVSSFFFYLGFGWIALDSRKQGWHDKIAGTVVVRVRGGARAPVMQP
jgi:uncharacterized RDD family membrane protein YckC